MSSGLLTLLTLRAAGPRGRVRRPEGGTAKRERQRGEEGDNNHHSPVLSSGYQWFPLPYPVPSSLGYFRPPLSPLPTGRSEGTEDVRCNRATKWPRKRAVWGWMRDRTHGRRLLPVCPSFSRLSSRFGCRSLPSLLTSPLMSRTEGEVMWAGRGVDEETHRATPHRSLTSSLSFISSLWSSFKYRMWNEVEPVEVKEELDRWIIICTFIILTAFSLGSLAVQEGFTCLVSRSFPHAIPILTSLSFHFVRLVGNDMNQEPGADIIIA